MFKDSIGYYHVAPEDDGSRVTVGLKMVLPHFMLIIMAIMRKKAVKADLKRLKALMEK